MNVKCISCKYADVDCTGYMCVEYCRYPNFGQSLDVDGTAYMHELSDGYCPLEREKMWNNVL